jgi:Fe-coproporphyrin III synthase
VEDWRKLIRNTLKKIHVYVVTLVEGEPLMREDIIRTFCDEMPRLMYMVTNGIFYITHISQSLFLLDITRWYLTNT